MFGRKDKTDGEYVLVEHAQVTLMTYNIGCLPSIPPFQSNGDFLRPNLERVGKIAETIVLWNQTELSVLPAAPQVICFQEAFDYFARQQLLESLTPFYPYNSGTLGTMPLNAGSGLLLFSQYPIREMNFHHFTNLMFGAETLANKGFIALKLQSSPESFFNVYGFHLGTPGIEYDKQVEVGGTTSVRRGEEMATIFTHMQTQRHKSPAANNLVYEKTFVCADFNTTLNSSRQMLSVSTGLSNNGYEQSQIKYPGQYLLFNELMQPNVPKNFKEVRALPHQKGTGKHVVPDLLSEAKTEDKFTGSTFSDATLKSNKKDATPLTRQMTEGRIIDGVFASRDGEEGEFESEIVSLEEMHHTLTNDTSYPYRFSDHLARIGVFKSVGKLPQKDATPAPEAAAKKGLSGPA